MMPGGQARRVHGEPRLSCEWSGHDFARRQDRGVLSAKAKRFAQLNEVFRLEFVAGQRSAHVARAKVRLLQCELRCSCQRRRDVRVRGNVAKRENIWMIANLQGRLVPPQPM